MHSLSSLFLGPGWPRSDLPATLVPRSQATLVARARKRGARVFAGRPMISRTRTIHARSLAKWRRWADRSSEVTSPRTVAIGLGFANPFGIVTRTRVAVAGG